MNYQLAKTQAPSSLLVLGFFEDDKTHKTLEQYDFKGFLNTDLLPHKKATSLLLSTSETPVMLVNLGKKGEYDIACLKKACTHLIKTVGTLHLDALSICFPPLHEEEDNSLRQLVIELDFALYEFNQCKSEVKDDSTIKTIHLISAGSKTALAEGCAIGAGVTLTRDLANRPANQLTPTDIANQARALADTYDALSVSVLDEAAMKEKGMNTILAVSQGSDEPAQFIDLRYEQGGDSAPIVLVGKGITFDSGGLSLKPPTAMTEMKYDMCGAATVLGVLKSACELKLPLNIIGLIASSENLPGPKALKPGDVITSYSKQTIEVLNTDAEGRLVLSDALTYAEQFKPAKVIDIATLTGAMIIALGYKTNGVMGNSDALCQSLCDAGRQIGDKAWQMPLWEEYQELIDSNVADMCNISNDKSAGSITAGCFLARFAKKYDWAHIDCAGTAWVPGTQKNGSGRPVPLLIQFLLNEVK